MNPKKQYSKHSQLTIGDTNATIGLYAPMSDFIGHQNLDQYTTNENGLRQIEFQDQQELYALNSLFPVWLFLGRPLDESLLYERKSLPKPQWSLLIEPQPYYGWIQIPSQ